MKLAIIGGGLFGSTAAILAARAGHEVHLIEAGPVLMGGATASSFNRVHRGYHYPRSPQTGRESRGAEASFRAEYGEAVIDGGVQLYRVPPGSRVSAQEFAQFLDAEGLPYSEQDGAFAVAEPRIDATRLAHLVREKVRDAGVSVHLGAQATHDLRNRFDRIVVAAYAGLNTALQALGCKAEPYKFQVVERPVVALPEAFRATSIVVIDGPFGCIDPLDETPFHILGHVVHANHASNVGTEPEVPAHLQPLIGKGLVEDVPHSRFRAMADDLERYIPGVGAATHVGSSFVVRAHLAHQEATDARPTLVQRADEQVIKVFSGKLGTAVVAARAVCDSLATEQRVAA